MSFSLFNLMNICLSILNVYIKITTIDLCPEGLHYFVNGIRLICTLMYQHITYLLKT